MNHSLYIYYLFVSYKLSVRMQIKRIFVLKSVFGPTTPPPESVSQDLPLRSNSKR